ncbi:hypothetical protein HZH68_003407 [Vespula germanica]|uniref:Uncharacterized protein n=1 Tax=Vespula germanica TaxID=30212 RepID=A0A834NP36_VESGE|nr:hypothetical protein HZH68_003407 [Vespula germanica]
MRKKTNAEKGPSRDEYPLWGWLGNRRYYGVCRYPAWLYHSEACMAGVGNDVVPLKGDFIDQPIRVTESQAHFEREVRYESYALPHSFRGNSLERSLYSAMAHENTRMLKKFFEHFVAERRIEHSKCLRCFQEKIFL